MPGIPEVKYDSYYTHDEISAFLHACAEASDGLMQVESLVHSPEGRDVWLATISDPAGGGPQEKPAYFVQANVHARELAGATAALRLVHTLLTKPSARAGLRETTFYVVPRTNPDGAEYSMTLNGPIRSRNEVMDKPNGLIPEDLDGDGKIRLMRWEDPCGPYAQDPEDPRILVPRRPDDEGPFFQQYTEGVIHDYDGGAIVSALRHLDFNRHYPANWDRSVDAASYPLQHPEIRAVAEFLFERRNIFAGLEYHCGTQAILRVPGSADQLPESDLGLMLEVGKMAERITGLTLMDSGDYRETWRKRITLPGNSDDFAYHSLGVSWFVIELGNTFSSAGIAAQDYFAADSRTREREFMRQVLQFVDDNPGHPWDWKEWSAFDHPQLGPVEIGGTEAGNIIMPYPPHTEELTARTTEFILEHAALRPQLALSGAEVARVGDGVYRIRARVANVGRFGTAVMSTAVANRTHEPLRVSLDLPKGAQVLSRPATYEFTSLAGGGAFQPLEWFLSAPAGAAVTVRAAHPRGGRAQAALSLD